MENYQIKAETDNDHINNIKNLATRYYNGRTFAPIEIVKQYLAVLRTVGINCLTKQQVYDLLYSALNELDREARLKKVNNGVYQAFLEPEMNDTVTRIVASDDTIVFGEPKETQVYLWYFPTFAKMSKIHNQKRFQCKVGRTSNGYEIRLSGTQSTDPEPKKLGLLIYTDNPVEVERMIHLQLMLMKREVKEAPGREWFWTNPDEVADIYRSVLEGRDEYLLQHKRRRRRRRSLNR